LELTQLAQLSPHVVETIQELLKRVNPTAQEVQALRLAASQVAQILLQSRQVLFGVIELPG
jgi:hypothetical protein